MLMLLLGTALALPPGYKMTKQVNDCVLALGPADQGDVPMLAECHWADATLAKADSVMSNWEGHDEVFSSVVSSNIVRNEGGYALVHQVHHAKGISDREITIWMQKTTVGDGYKYAWYKATEEPQNVGKGRVEAGRSTGYWEFHPHPEGGVKAVHHLYYNPGGSVPGFLVRWFQTAGLEATVTEMRAALK